jgi:multidrug resistance efflux pump
MSGALQDLSVVRGAQVREGDPLFDLENGYEKAGRDEARRRVAQAQANLDDAKTGQHPTELESIQAQIDCRSWHANCAESRASNKPSHLAICCTLAVQILVR